MKKTMFFVIISYFLILSSITYAVCDTTELRKNTVNYYAAEDLTDLTNRNNLTNSSANMTSGIISKAFWTGKGSYLYQTNNWGATFAGTGNKAFSSWVYKTGNSAEWEHIIRGGSGTNKGDFGAYIESASTNTYFTGWGTGDINTNVNITATGWYFVTIVYNGTHINAYTNATLISSSAMSSLNTGDAQGFIGRDKGVDTRNAFIGYIDELALFNYSIPSDCITFLFNSGSPTSNQQYPYTTPTVANFTISASDDWTTGTISSFNASVDGVEYTTSTGIISTPLLQNSTTLHNITVYSNGYFNKTFLNYNVSSNIITTLTQAIVCFNATAKVSGSAISSNFTINASTRQCFNITAGTYSVFANKTGWFDKNQTIIITALQNNTQTIVNMSYANLTISAKDGTTNESLTNCDTAINSVNWTSWTGESQTATTNASYYLINGTYNASIICSGYALTYGQANITVSGHTNYTFTLYKTNSVTINILDEITNTPITSNITIRWTNNATTWENITSTGQLFIYNLTPSNYTLLFYGSNYSTRTYTITVGNLSTQFLTAYMVSSIYSTILTVKDKDTGDILPDVGFTLYKLVNSSWTTVESKYTDITGKVQIYYDPIGNYRFYFAKTNYEDLIFYLNPVLFDTYDVFMEKTSPLNYTVDYDDISIIYSPQVFNNNANTTLNFLISSPEGKLISYSIRLTYPGGTGSDSGTNAIGEQMSAPVNIVGATRWDRVTLEYNYTTTLSGLRTFTQYLSINTNATASENTWMANKDRTFGLGLFERVLIVTIIIIFTAGISTLVGQPLPGMILGIFLFGFMVFIGFIPIWSVLPSIMIGVFFLIWKSGG